MRVVACLSWFLEPAGFLDRMAGSLEGFADVLVAMDGPWASFPHGSHRSTDREYAELEAGCARAGVRLEVVSVDAAFSTQQAKRTALMTHAAGFGDWLFVIDGDEWIARLDGPAARRKLATELDSDEGLDVGTVTCVNVTSKAPVDGRIRRVYRAALGVTVERVHNGYRTADGRWLHGDHAYVRLEPTFHLPVTLHHDRGNRGDERNAAREEYRRRRRDTREEAWR